MQKNLSKSKLLAFQQCPKRLWLEVHRSDLSITSAATEVAFKVGHEVGEIAWRLYDPKRKGTILDPKVGHGAALKSTKKLIESAKPIFEAGFAAAGAIAYADVLLPKMKAGKRVWRMVEVKSSTEVKDYHRDDAAIQAFVARQAKLPLVSIAIARIDSDWVYPGGGQYDGLLKEQDLTREAFGRGKEVKAWIAAAQKVVAMKNEPVKRVGRHCDHPFECSFKSYCQSQEPQAAYPAAWLPRVQSNALRDLLNGGVTELADVPDELLNPLQLRVKTHTLADSQFFDRRGAAADLAKQGWPAYFLDFETIYFAVPIWAGTRPYQQIPFQFSLHQLARNGKLTHSMFLDLSGADPSLAIAKALVASCGTIGPVFVYNASFEKTRIKALAERFKPLKTFLLAINKRIVDLRPIVERRYYHPCQQGSFSIKSLLPTISKDVSYDALDGVRDGAMAMEAYIEAIAPVTPRERHDEIRAQLSAYCALDTLAMVKLWRFLTGRDSLKI